MPSDSLKVAPAGRPLSATAIALMVMLCLSWGFNQITVKLALPEIPPLLPGDDPLGWGIGHYPDGGVAAWRAAVSA